jgi:hypothetical protein
LSEQPGQEAGAGTPRGDDDTHVIPGAPGPSGTGVETDAGGDPDAPTAHGTHGDDTDGASA